MLESKYPSCYVKIPGTANGSSELQRLPAEHWKAFVEGLQRAMKAEADMFLILLDQRSTSSLDHGSESKHCKRLVH